MPLQRDNEIVGHGEEHEVSCEKDVDQEQHEVFPVPIANTIVDPRAVMVHIENATIASRAVVTTLRLEHIAHQAVPPSLVLRVSQVESLIKSLNL